MEGVLKACTEGEIASWLLVMFQRDSIGALNPCAAQWPKVDVMFLLMGMLRLC